MVRKLVFLSGVLFLNSCISQIRLKDGTRVPDKNYVFKNSSKFDVEIFNKINNNYLYELKENYFVDRSNNKIRNFGTPTARYLQFYNTGQVRDIYYFEPNPSLTGKRGFVYMNKGKIQLDITQATQDGDIYINTFRVVIEEDKLYLVESSFSLFGNNSRECYVYEKSEKIPEDWKQYKANW